MQRSLRPSFLPLLAFSLDPHVELSGPGRSRPGRTNLEVLLSPYLAVTMLSQLVKNRVQLTEAQFYEAQDAVIALLEESNDHKYSLVTPKGEESKP